MTEPTWYVKVLRRELAESRRIAKEIRHAERLRERRRR